MGGEGRGWCEGEKEWLAGAKVVSSGLWNQELLFACYSATPLHCRHRSTHSSTHALYSYDLCSTLVSLECRLSPPPTSLSVSHPSFSCKIAKNKRGSSVPCYKMRLCVTHSECESCLYRVTEKNF